MARRPNRQSPPTLLGFAEEKSDQDEEQFAAGAGGEGEAQQKKNADAAVDGLARGLEGLLHKNFKVGGGVKRQRSGGERRIQNGLVMFVAKLCMQ